MDAQGNNAGTTSRRGFIAGAAIAAGALASAGLATGCSKGREYQVGKEYLPIGSVVRIRGEVEADMHMIIARRPMTDFVKDRVTGEHSVYDRDGNVEPYDYACVNYPFGLLSNPHTILGDADAWAEAFGLSGQDYRKNDLVYMGDILMFNKEEIAEVLHVGYDKPDIEQRAAKALNDAIGTPKSSFELLADLEEETGAVIKEQRESKENG